MYFFSIFEGSDRKGERADDEEDDRVTFVGPSSLAFEDEPKPHGQELHLDTQLATKNVLRNTDDKGDGPQRQVAPVTVRKHSSGGGKRSDHKYSPLIWSIAGYDQLTVLCVAARPVVRGIGRTGC